jgi:hypothetical protein
MDEKGSAMIRALILAIVIALCSTTARAHVGSPDVFYDGKIGPYPARVTIRMPNVVPGRAEITVRVQSSEPVDTSFLPVYAWTAASNAPPADIGRLVTGETNLFTGELWLMSFGAYSVEVHVNGTQGNGVVQIPVTSVAIRQLPMPSLLGKLLLLLGLILVVGGIGIVSAAFREAALAPGAAPGKPDRRRGWIAAAIVTLLFVLAVVGGREWWNEEENDFRRHLREGAWPDLTVNAVSAGVENILQLEVGKKFFQQNNRLAVIPDHGKMMHLFLVREGSRDAFAHLHPIRKDAYKFEVALPPLPEGRYAIYCDLAFEGGVCSTATNSIQLPLAPSANIPSASAPQRDPDDSWASQTADAVPAAANANPAFRLPDGEQVVWQTQKPLRVNQDASLRFTVTDATGAPIALEPYMGMLSHAAVLRRDGSVFAHLHPAGNYSMAAQSFFENKLATEANAGVKATDAGAMDHSMHHGHARDAVSSVYLPYEFPEPGDYRIWVQFKTGTRVLTAVFDAQVEP